MGKYYNYEAIPKSKLVMDDSALDHPFESHPNKLGTSKLIVYKDNLDKWNIFKANGVGEESVLAALSEEHYSVLADKYVGVETAHNKVAVIYDDPEYGFGISSEIYYGHAEKSDPFFRLISRYTNAPNLRHDGSLYIGDPADPAFMDCSSRSPQYSLRKVKLNTMIPFLEKIGILKK